MHSGAKLDVCQVTRSLISYIRPFFSHDFKSRYFFERVQLDPFVSTGWN